MNLSFSRSKINRVDNDNSFTTPLQAIAQSPLSQARLDDGTANPNTLYALFIVHRQFILENLTEESHWKSIW
jgi:hypothetical protein